MQRNPKRELTWKSPLSKMLHALPIENKQTNEKKGLSFQNLWHWPTRKAESWIICKKLCLWSLLQHIWKSLGTLGLYMYMYTYTWVQFLLGFPLLHLPAEIPWGERVVFLREKGAQISYKVHSHIWPYYNPTEFTYKWTWDVSMKSTEKQLGGILKRGGIKRTKRNSILLQ